MDNMFKGNKPVAYVLSKELISACDKIPAVKNRASIVHSLIQSCGLTPKLNLINSLRASAEDIRCFHCEEYVQYLKEVGNFYQQEDDDELFGLGFDCPPMDGIWTVVQEIAGSSLTAAKVLISEEARVVINWCGGWHHAQRDSANGFCYINDIVLAIQALCKKFEKILYIDMDIHHGDGVENAFSFTPKVLTFSLHQLEIGFYPGTGKTTDVGMGRGKFYSVNVPYKAGISDSEMDFVFKATLKEIKEVFDFDAIVCQCGADSLAQDPLGGANISLEGYLNCIREVLKCNKPSLLFGGGGYHKANTAKLWTAITCIAVNEKIPEEVPEHFFFPIYGPDFTFEIAATLRKSENSDEYLQKVLEEVKGNLQTIKRLSLSASKS